MKRSPLTIVIALLLIAVFGLMLFVFQVRQSEVAVVTLFDKMESSGVRTNPGPHLKWPWPIERVYTLDQRVHGLDMEAEDKLEPITLPDQNIVLLLTYVGWRISDPARFFQNFENGSMIQAETNLQSIIRSAKLEVAGHHNFSDFLSADTNQIKFTQIEQEMLGKAREKVAAGKYGIEIKFMQIKSIELPATVSEDVFTRMKAERNKLADAIKADAESQSTAIRAKADSEATKLLAEADAKAKEIRGEGQQAMVQSLEIMAQNAELAKFLMSLTTLEDVGKEKTTWILNHNTTGLELLQAKPTPAGTNAPVPSHD
ncbi:MAG: protease modulator HflC [Verrucomicrobiota bacterium]|jgi:membrane protease subunit HflC